MYTPVEVTQKQQLIDLIILWKHVFGDDTDYIKTFYKYFCREMGIVAIGDENKKIVSACHFIPVSMKMRGIFCNGSYLYAAMTGEAHCGKGLMSEIIKKQFNTAYDKGEAFMCTLPASESLYSYYEKFDFTQVFNLDLVHLNRNHLSKIKLTLAFDSKLSPEFAYRKSFGVREYTVVKNKRFVDYTEVEYRTGEGGVFIPLYGGYLYVKETDDTVFIREAFVTNENLPYIASVLLRSFPNCDDFIFQICPKSAFANHSSTTVKAGSARIINADAILRLFALKNPTKTMTINLQDELIEKNNGLYLISGGKLSREEQSDDEKISIDELNKMVFTNFGEIIPYMNMMLN